MGTVRRPGGPPPTRRRFLRLSAAAAAAAGLGLPLDAFAVEPYWPRIARHRLVFEPPARPPSGLRILHLTDLHRSSIVPDRFLARHLARGMALEPHLVVLTGDYVTAAHSRWIDGLGDVLRALRAPLGVFAVPGNHDGGAWAGGHGGSPELTPMTRELESAGIAVLVNERITLVHGGVPFDVAGLGDLWAGMFDPAATFAGAGAGRFCLTLTHNPDTLMDLVEYPADLLLCGHTHGGQVRVPGLGAPILPVEQRRFDQGWFDLGAGRQAFVNRGLGMLRRVRFRCRPEMALLTIA